MNSDPSTVLFIWGLVRVGFWLIAAYLAFRCRLASFLIGSLLASLGAIVYVFSNAHLGVSSNLFNVATWLATPAVACFAAGLLILYRRKTAKGEQLKWRL